MTSNHHALMIWATHVLQWRKQREASLRGGANLKNNVSVRTVAATRLHEAGIASNRESECRGEYVPGLVHTARHTMGVSNARSQ